MISYKYDNILVTYKNVYQKQKFEHYSILSIINLYINDNIQDNISLLFNSY